MSMYACLFVEERFDVRVCVCVSVPVCSGSDMIGLPSLSLLLQENEQKKIYV